MKHHFKYCRVFLLVLLLSFIIPTKYSVAATKISNSIQYSNVMLAYVKFLKEYNHQVSSMDNHRLLDNHPIELSRDLLPVSEENIQKYSSEIRLNYTDLILPLDGYDSYLEYLQLLSADSDKVIWESSDSSIATVDKSGLVTAMLPGTCMITATYQGKTYSCDLKVPYIPDYESLACLQIVDSNIEYYEAYPDKFGNITMNHNLLSGVLFSDTEIEILDSSAKEPNYSKGTLDDLKRLCKEKKLVKIVMNHDLILSISETTLP
ncbi:Ig-like domain-containing protein [Lachnoclostridium phytofermentans]|uniref:Ig domain protein group 2 domain protein n=1 Tax=Lachnoclostridium phytofermentans (strain ATCC 700394 / DSM 18823 / ISDg) TaxID=357809 RepID=A9KSG6_LACP7|nr:Ig-like domain-containing protein [Lachnoclostridium phytofermentans]ABX43618.1 Ig domain protein group 2 domain protein [Lachnoclostridium phytofermentans ISDg]